MSDEKVKTLRERFEEVFDALKKSGWRQIGVYHVDRLYKGDVPKIRVRINKQSLCLEKKIKVEEGDVEKGIVKPLVGFKWVAVESVGIKSINVNKGKLEGFEKLAEVMKGE